VKRALGLGALLLAACPGSAASPRSSEPVDLVVVAPHPDDEVLTSAGVMRRALERGDRVAVIIVTNGDYTCTRDGNVRQAESIAALARVGVGEQNVYFLGYPDGRLPALGEAPITVQRRAKDGACVDAHETYAHRGAGHADAHTARTGGPAPYTAVSLEGDLAALLDRLKPRDLYVTHPMDDHDDHAATYAYVRRALERSAVAPPVIHRAIVHAGPCWPDGRDRATPCPPVIPEPAAPLPALPDPYAAYVGRERVPVDGAWKLGAIALYPSQRHPEEAHDWLDTFARANEAFYPEQLVADPARPGQRRRARAPGVAPGIAVAHGAWTSSAGTLRARDVEQRAPLRFTVSATAAGGDERVDVGMMSDGAEGYRLRIDRGRAALARIGAEGELRLRTWTFPADAIEAAHTYQVAIDPRPDDGDVTELTLRRDGAFIGVAIDPHAPPRGARVTVEPQAGARAGDMDVVADAPAP
jgi:LmbE family N-acetylglucosaminyl deacetylase